MKVIKRNGETVESDYTKIIKALKAAYAESNIPFEVLPEHEETLVKAILKTNSDTLNVEDIQDLVEQYLMTAGELTVLTAFILYREKHKEARFITNRIDYMKRYTDSRENAASSSETDANANVQIKNVSNLEGEVYKITNRTIQRKRMKDKLKELFPEVYKQYELDLNHHIIYAHDDTSVLDKFRLHGKEFTSSLDGGVGLHANLQEHLSKEQYLKLIDFAIQKGTSYFTFNVPNTQCDDCNAIYKQPLEVCPKCGSHNMTQWTRVIGFLRPIKGFSKERYIEALKRTYTSPTEFTEI